MLTDTTLTVNGDTQTHEIETWSYVTGADGSNDTIDTSAWTGLGISIYGYGGDDVLKGSAGNDSIDGGAGIDTLYGNDGDDYITGSSENDTLYGGLGNDDLRGGTENDTLYGEEGNDYLDWNEYWWAYGDFGQEAMFGGVGDDYFRVNADDEFSGDEDTDRVAIFGATTVVLTDTQITVNDNTFSHDIENWEITGTNDDDSIDASAWTGAGLSISGLDGNNLLKGGAGDDLIQAGAGADTLEGNEGNDDLRGGQGDDLIVGGLGNDYLNWNDGYDTYGDHDQMFGGVGDDSIRAYPGDQFHGEADFDQIQLISVTQVVLNNASITVNGNSFAHDVESWNIYGTDSADSIDASAWTGAGVYIEGYSGDDHLIGGSGNDAIYGGYGADTIEGRDGNDYIDNYYWDPDVDTVYPGKGSNTVQGSYNYFNDLVIVEGEVTADTFDAHYYSYVLNGEQTNVYYNASVTFNTNGGEDVVNTDGGLPYTLIVNGLKPSISAVRLGLTVHGIFKDAGDNQTWTGTLDFGEGPVALTLESDKTFSYTLPYELTEDIVVEITDNQGNVGTTIVVEPYLDLSGNTVAENLGGTLIGDLSFANKPPFSAGPYTYSLVTGDGDDDNASFYVYQNQIYSNATFDFETKNNYTIRVHGVDEDGLILESAFAISVTNVNETPSAPGLSNQYVDENLPAGTVVGSLTSTDPDFGDTITYSLVSGYGDNLSFSIDGANLKTAASFDYETNYYYYIQIRATDAGGLYSDNYYTIYVNNVNDAPSDITLSNNTVDENQPAGTSVGSFGAYDDDGGSFTFTLVGGTGSSDNGQFSLVDGNLTTNTSFDYEVGNAKYIRVRATDSGGSFFEKQFTISIANVNEAPTDVSLSNNSVPENEAIGTVVGALYTTDPDAGDTFTYLLVAGAGSGDNASFTIDSGALKTNAIFDYETKSSYSIRVRSTDAGGISIEKILTISVSDVGEGTTDIELSSSTLAENNSSGQVIGAFSIINPPASSDGPYTYALIVGEGDADNGAFQITGANLEAGSSFDYETKNSYSIRVRVTDEDGATFEKAFVISVTNVNEDPTDIGLSNNSLAENLAAGTTVGTLSSTDPDAGESFTYTLVSGAGSTDNASFVIESGILKTAASFNYEVQNSYSVRVRSTDAGGLFTEKSFTIGVTNINETPTNITLSASSVAENQPANTSVGSLSTTDPDNADSFTYMFVSGAGSDDNTSFTIDAGVLKTSASFNFEVKNSYTVRVRSTDAGGLFTEKAFTIGVTNVNESPTDIGLTNNLIAENQPSGATIGTLGTTDPDAGDSFVYTLVSGTGSTDNASFNIDSGVLKSAASFDFETKNSYSVRIRTTDAGGLFTEKAFTIGVTNVNESPTDISLTNNFIAENQPTGSTIGTLTTTDPDAGDSFTYTLVTGTGSTDNGSFTIDSGVLKANASFDFETKNSYAVRVRTTDAGGLFTEKAFTIGVTNVNESPTDINLSNSSISEGLPSGSNIGALSTLDPDASDSFTYNLVAGTGANDNASFTIVGGELKTAAVFDYEVKNSYSVRVRSTDGGGLSTDKVFTISVVDDGESAAPTITGITTALPVTYKENALTPLLIASAGVVADVDSPNFDGGKLTVKFDSNGTADDRLRVKHIGTAANQIGVIGSDIYFHKKIGTVVTPILIGSFTGGVGIDPLVLTFNANATKTEAQAALRAIVFENGSENPSSLARVVSFVLTDGDGGTSIPSTRTVNVTAVNDKPILITSGSTISYTENDAPIIIDGGVLISDVDSADFDTGKLTVKIAAGSKKTDRIGIASGGSISTSGLNVLFGSDIIGTFAGTTTLTITLNSLATPERVQELARQITYSNISDAPATMNATETRNITFSLTDGDKGTSAVALIDYANVTPVNDVPVIGNLTGSIAAKYTENGAPLLIASAGTVIDPDLWDFGGGKLTVAFIDGTGTSDDQLGIKNVGTGSNQVSIVGTEVFFTKLISGVLTPYKIGDFTGGNGGTALEITFTSNAYLAEVQATLKAILFSNGSDNPSSQQRHVSFILEDGEGGISAAAVKNIDFTVKNDAPTVLQSNFGGDVNWKTGDPATLLSTSATVTDPDSTDFLGGKLTVALTTNKQTLDRIEIQQDSDPNPNVGIKVSGNTVSYNGNAIGTFAGTTTLTITFTTVDANAEAVQALLQRISFKSTSASLLTRTVTAKVSDGDGGTSVVVTKGITVT